MIDSIGFHTDRDLQAELATLNRHINALAGQIAIGNFHSPEAAWNTSAQLTNYLGRAERLAEELAAEQAELDRLAAAIRTVGDMDLGFIAYVVFGPAALPVPPLYEVRVIERTGGYTVPGLVRRRVAAEDIVETQRELLDAVMKRGGHADVWGHTIRDYCTQVTAY
ncbi:hypothetical protein [Streptomyces sp. ML-6]|uniref:hypothetical protein n=1 Tax=Streptomyces sp. ML-6 TaxID=2982693 RepID=UPI0024BF8B37|nr:hypothetical protein [Streptomyces sp. ML-6]MDK0525065.1 hypothetical protein [Streptomyces sp. ML-6]